jgi:hypothetical protein
MKLCYNVKKSKSAGNNCAWFYLLLTLQLLHSLVQKVARANTVDKSHRILRDYTQNLTCFNIQVMTFFALRNTFQASHFALAQK